MVMKPNKFRGPTGWLTQSLFADAMTQSQRPGHAEIAAKSLYWLETKYEDDNRPVFRDLFIKLKDPTGVEAAKLYLGGYDHYQHLLKASPWFKEPHDRWVREIEQTLKAEAIKRMKLMAEESEGAVRLAANKYLAGKEYDKETSRRGRPTATEVEGELKRQARSSSPAETDLQRMNKREELN